MADRPFLSRWSRLKQEARAQPPARRGGAAPVMPEPGRDQASPPQAPANDAPAAAGHGAREPEEARFDASTLPDVDSLTVESDFTQFLRKEVPKTLQRKALRKLWTSDPVFACLDGLNDYEEDFTDAATVMEGMKSSYQVGRGFLTDEELAENHSVYRASRDARIEAEEQEAADAAPVDAPMDTPVDAPVGAETPADAAPESEDRETAAPAADSPSESRDNNKNDNHS